MRAFILELLILFSFGVYCHDEISQPWSALLENWIISKVENNHRSSRVMKFGDKPFTIRQSPTMATKREVSETDLYLLGAIEKLLYRVDKLERRVLRAEELIYYLISGNSTDSNACPENYTKIKKHCYHFSSREYDWKSSASLCRGLGGNLLEVESIEEKHIINDFLQRDKILRGRDFWTGGLNPGLLWIWSSSAQQVPEDKSETIEDGSGRCLMLHYKMATGSYFFYGAECIKKMRYICKLIDNDSFNVIEKSARALLQKKKNSR